LPRERGEDLIEEEGEAKGNVLVKEVADLPNKKRG